ncbi:MAG: DEAD/DEAH box helicase [Mycetocola sp.]
MSAFSEQLSGITDPDQIFDAFESWANGRGLTLYPAQEEAAIELVSGNNVILSTPTGTGKSMVAIAAHAVSIARGERSYYTAPIKALVSEKFFALVDIFGAANVGMMTGDSSVNPDAPIICCTAEILANLSLRLGEDTPVGSVVMDEFHYYGDPDRGWAWQVPLLTLPHAQFLLMSATLGDVTELADDLSRRTGRDTAEVTGVERPVPLSFEYATTPVHETVDELMHTQRAPVYIVHFSQAQALERAQGLAGMGLVSRAARDKIGESIAGFRFSSGFGTSLNRLLRLGVGVHHAGMLPKYRRLVERLAQDGLLPIICGTDTLGVGINVPIRSVLFTALTKYDGTRMRQLSAREFHQIAGRAGRAGFDTAGSVIVQAPEHEIDNLKAIQKAGDDPKKKRKIVRKKAPDGFVSWGEPSFERLITKAPETLVSQMRVSHAMVLAVIARGGDAFSILRALVFDNHEPRHRQRALAIQTIRIVQALLRSGVVVRATRPSGEVGFEVTVDVQPGFALNQPLSPFALAAFELIEPIPDSDPRRVEYALDIVSISESTLDNPRPILMSQEHRARGEAIQAMKADGVDYDTRMELIEQITYPKPLEELLTAAFEEYRAASPWVGDQELQPKSVVREMYERAMTFGEYVSFHGIQRSEGVLLRYLSDAFRALRQTIPDDKKSEALAELISWLGEVVSQTDSSLLDEWEQLSDPDAVVAVRDEVTVRPRSVLDSPVAFTVMVRNEMFRRVLLLDRDDYETLGSLDSASGMTADRWADAAAGYWDEYSSINTGPAARGPGLFVVEHRPQDWLVRQIIDDPDGEHGWSITARVDLAASAERGEAVLLVDGFAQSGTL